MSDFPPASLVLRVGRHFIRAVSTWIDLQRSSAIGESILFNAYGADRGVLVLDEAHRIVHMNGVATRLLQGRYSLSHGRMLLHDKEWRSALQRLVAGTTRSLYDIAGAGPVPLLREHGRLPLLASATPLPTEMAGEIGRRALALLTLTDPESDGSGSVPALIALGLTPSEARIAALVGAACPPAETARHLGLTEVTVRSVIATIYTKLNITRQSQLVQLVVRTG